MRIAQLSVLTKHCCLHQHHIISCYQRVFCGSVATVVRALNRSISQAWIQYVNVFWRLAVWYFRQQEGDVVLPLEKYITLQRPASVLWRREKRNRNHMHSSLQESYKRPCKMMLFVAFVVRANTRCHENMNAKTLFCNTYAVITKVAHGFCQGNFAISAPMYGWLTGFYLNLFVSHPFLL